MTVQAEEGGLVVAVAALTFFDETGLKSLLCRKIQAILAEIRLSWDLLISLK